jgi:hypothetical protein
MSAEEPTFYVVLDSARFSAIDSSKWPEDGSWSPEGVYQAEDDGFEPISGVYLLRIFDLIDYVAHGVEVWTAKPDPGHTTRLEAVHASGARLDKKLGTITNKIIRRLALDAALRIENPTDEATRCNRLNEKFQAREIPRLMLEEEILKVGDGYVMANSELAAKCAALAAVVETNDEKPGFPARIALQMAVVDKLPAGLEFDFSDGSNIPYPENALLEATWIVNRLIELLQNSD